MRQSIIDGYKNLKNDNDRKLFEDWMMINLNMYLKKFEEENFGPADYEMPPEPPPAEAMPPEEGAMPPLEGGPLAAEEEIPPPPME